MLLFKDAGYSRNNKRERDSHDFTQRNKEGTLGGALIAEIPKATEVWDFLLASPSLQSAKPTPIYVIKVAILSFTTELLESSPLRGPEKA